MTDESDAYLLYTLDISEDDFHLLKTEQSILVDFPTFPSKFVESCSASRRRPPVRSTHGSWRCCRRRAACDLFGDGDESVPAAHPPRPALRRRQRRRHQKVPGGPRGGLQVSAALHARRAGDRTQQLQETAELASAQTEKLRTIEEDHSRKVRELEVRQESALADAKKAAAEAAHEQSRLSRSRARACGGAIGDGAVVSANVTRADGGELCGAHLRPSRARAPAARALLDFEGAEAELALKQEGVLREENSKLSAQSHKLEKELAAKQVELAAALQSAKDKEALLAKMTSLHEAATDAKRQLEDSLGMYKDNNAKLQEKLKLSASEITKGNTII